MTNPTSNFGWQMPTPVDLVTDLPADFEVFGQAVDTSLADLKGGTTGQILSKATNTDMDFTWIANDQGDITGVTATSPLTGGGTSGAITVGILSGTTSNLGAVQLSTSTSSTSTSLAATASAVKSAYDVANSAPISNPVLNSAFNVWQRGTSFSTTNVYCADRWFMAMNTGQGTFERKVTGDTTNLPNIQYCIRLQRNVGSTSTTAQAISQSFESVNSIPYAGKTVTFSFYVRAGADYSGGANFLSQVRSGTGTDQNMESGFTGSSSFINNTITPTATWTRYSYSGNVASNATQLGVYFNYTPSGTAGANDYVEITGVQIDVGSVALPFRTNQPTYVTELGACQRYFQKSYEQATAPGASTAANYIVTLQQSAVAYGSYAASVKLPVTMRTSPTYVIYSPVDGTTSVLADAAANTNLAAGSGTVGTNSNDSSLVIRNITTSPASITPGFGGFSFQYTASAEL
jgi:hypothetical protein